MDSTPIDNATNAIAGDSPEVRHEGASPPPPPLPPPQPQLPPPPQPSPPQPHKQRDELHRIIKDARPKIRLPGPGRLLSDFARDLGKILCAEEIFYRNGEI